MKEPKGSIMINSKSILIGVFIVFLGCLSFKSSAAIRCQGQLIGPGESEYILTKACGTPIHEYRVSSGRNGSGDEVYYYYEQDGRTIEIHLIDGHIYEIDGDNKH